MAQQLEAKVFAGAVRVTEDELVLEWAGLSAPRPQRKARLRRIPLSEIRVIECRYAGRLAQGWVRFGATPLAYTPVSPPAADLDWIAFTGTDRLSELAEVTEVVAKAAGVDNPLRNFREVEPEAGQQSTPEQARTQARIARQSGSTLFQVALPLSETARTASSLFSGTPETTTRATLHANALEGIEAEGWRLEHASYYFQETGAVSRDKLLSSGQTTQVTGQAIGVYIFRATELPPAP